MMYEDTNCTIHSVDVIRHLENKRYLKRYRSFSFGSFRMSNDFIPSKIESQKREQVP